MPIAFAVHGTSDTGPEDGPRWWQRGGALDSDLRTFVEGEDGEAVTLQPILWDGSNSERSRRNAGRLLARRLEGLEPSGAPYCVIGHSHGGSVIAHALLDCAVRGRTLPLLARWITVGAPFIRTEKQRLRFARLGLVGRAAYLTALSMVAAPALYLIVRAFFETSWDDLVYLLGDLMLSLVQYGLPFALFFILTEFADRKRYQRYRPQVLDRARVSFEPSWLALNHPSDEAIQGLAAVERLKGKIFNRDLLVAPLQLTVLMLFPILIAGGLLSNQIDALTALPVLNDPAFRTTGAIMGLPYLIFDQVLHIDEALPAPIDYLTSEILLIGLAPALIVFLLALVTLSLIYLPSLAVSALTTRTLDPITWRQIRQSAYGNDIAGETALSAMATPAWGSPVFPALSGELSTQLAAQADAAAARALAKFRAELSRLATGERSHRDFIADYVTWEELVHTAYFRDALFRKLVCFAVAQAPGFRASPALREDADFARLQAWHDALSSGREPAHARIGQRVTS